MSARKPDQWPDGRRAAPQWWRRGLLLAAIVVVGAVAWFGTWLGASNELSWTSVVVDDLVIGVEIEGTLASRDSSLVTPPPAASVYNFKIRFMAPEGSLVPEGTPVLGFDTSELDQRLLSLQNEAEKAKKNIEKLDADHEQQIKGLELRSAEAEAGLGKARLKNDIPDDLRSAAEARKAGLDVGLAEMEVESVRGQLEAALTVGQAQRAALVARKERAERLVRETSATIDRMMVKSPRAGTVIYVTNWRGDKKKVGDSAWRHERIIELPDLSQMMGRGEVDEADAGRIVEGQPVSLRLDAHPDIEYRAEIESIWRTVRRKRNSRNPLKIVRLDLALDETDTERMRPGMRFRGTIEADRVTDALLIPAHALFPTDEGPVVYRRTLLGFESVSVVPGQRNSSQVQVLAGLSAGDLVAETNPEL